MTPSLNVLDMSVSQAVALTNVRSFIIYFQATINDIFHWLDPYFLGHNN